VHSYVRFGIGVAALVLLTGGCSPGAARRTTAAQPAAPAARSINVDHVQPARDFVGPVPQKFVWTAVPGADAYSIGIWNEVDMLLFRQNNIAATEYARPAEWRLEPGTYFWAVSALRDGEEIAQSGLAAFVVRTTD
jgi:hypothetical protein